MSRSALLIYDPIDIPRNGWFIEELIKNAHLHDISMRLMTSDAPRPADIPALMLNRSRDASWSEWGEANGVRVCNSAAVTAITNDKLRTYAYLHGEFGVPMAESWAADTDLSKLPMPIVCKPCGGHGGEDVRLISDIQTLTSVLEQAKSPYLLQEPVVFGWDVRVYILGGEIYAAVLRTSDCDFRSNFSLGGKAELFSPDAEMRKLAAQIQEIMPLDFAGIDFLRRPEGGYVLGEIEDAVGCRMLYALTALDPAADLIRYAASLLKK